MSDRLVPEGGGEDVSIHEGDVVEYTGNWEFEGEVTNVNKLTVTVKAENGSVKRFDHMDLQPNGGDA